MSIILATTALSLLEEVGKHGLAKACERWSLRRTFSVVVLAPQQKIFYSDGWYVVWRYISFLLLDCSAWVLIMKIYTTFCSILYVVHIDTERTCRKSGNTQIANKNSTEGL